MPRKTSIALTLTTVRQIFSRCCALSHRYSWERNEDSIAMLRLSARNRANVNVDTIEFRLHNIVHRIDAPPLWNTAGHHLISDRGKRVNSLRLHRSQPLPKSELSASKSESEPPKILEKLDCFCCLSQMDAMAVKMLLSHWVLLGVEGEHLLIWPKNVKKKFT